ncbi:MAG TPA: TetR/AcrR family transcriptional regulator [Thermomicrobiales bacterium]|nr:TetR/AcrR family transcriptional regulator [Thermomicrobiales bacterium]
MTKPAKSPAEERGSTRNQILDAAIHILGRDGYKKLTARAIAAEAGTNLALVNYYFGSKQNLLLAIFDELDRRKVERQRDMYTEEEATLSAKWREAVAYYRQDLADGYVRILQELFALGYSDPVIASRVRERRVEWRALIRDVVTDHAPGLGIEGIPPHFIADAIVSFWSGMETEHLIGFTEDDVPFFQMLDFVGNWLAEREAQSTQPAGQMAAGDTE